MTPLRCWSLRAPILTAALLSLLAIHASPARAGSNPFDGPQAGGATFGAGLLAGIACWTFELGTSDRYRIDEVEERDDDFERAGWYASLSGAYVLEVIDEGEEQKALEEAFAPSLVGFELDSRHSGGVRGVIGRRCHERVAVELDIQWMAPFEGKIETPEAVLVDVDLDIVTATVNTKAYALTGRLQPYGLLGVGTIAIITTSKNRADSKGGEKDTGNLVVRGGGGVDFYVDRHWVVNLEASYLWSATNLDYFDFFTLSTGVTYRF